MSEHGAFAKLAREEAQVICEQVNLGFGGSARLALQPNGNVTVSQPTNDGTRTIFVEVVLEFRL